MQSEWDTVETMDAVIRVDKVGGWEYIESYPHAFPLVEMLDWKITTQPTYFHYAC